MLIFIILFFQKRGNKKGEIILNSIRGIEEVENQVLDQNNNVFQVNHFLKKFFKEFFFGINDYVHTEK